MEDVRMDILRTRIPQWIEDGKAAVCVREISEQEFRGQYAIGVAHFVERVIALALHTKETKEQVYTLEEAPMFLEWFGFDAVSELLAQIIEFSDLMPVVEDMGW